MKEMNDRIYEVLGVMLDFDLAALYQVETRVLKQAVAALPMNMEASKRMAETDKIGFKTGQHEKK